MGSYCPPFLHAPTGRKRVVPDDERLCNRLRKPEKAFENAIPRVFAAGVDILFVIVSSLCGGGVHYSFEKGQDEYNAISLDGLIMALTDGGMVVKGFGLYTSSAYLQYAVYGDDPGCRAS